MSNHRVAAVLLVLVALLPLPVAAQIIPGAASVVFSMDGLEASASAAGMAGSNETAVFSDEAILSVSPNPFVPTFAVASADYATWSAYFGDDDADGSYVDSIIGTVDALYIPQSASLPPSIFDIYLSFQVDVAPGGILAANGVGIDESDIVKLQPRGGFITFISKAQIVDGLAIASPPSSLDVNGFSVDSATGDLYFTFTATISVNGTSMSDGGVARLPGSGYTTNPDGTVASVVPGAGEVVLHEADTDAMFLAAGLNGITDCFGICVDPAGGTFTSPVTGTTMAHLWLVDDDASDGPSIVTTQGGGAIANLGPSVFNSAGTLGLSPTDPGGGAAGNLSALTFYGSPLPTKPLVTDTFPLSVTTPGTLTIDIGGGTPGNNVILLAKWGEGMAIGGFTYRWSIFLSMLPMFDVPGGFQELYINDPTDPLTVLLFQEPALTVDADGYASKSFAVPSLPPGTAVAFQAFDLTNFKLSTPVIPIFQ